MSPVFTFAYFLTLPCVYCDVCLKTRSPQLLGEKYVTLATRDPAQQTAQTVFSEMSFCSVLGRNTYYTTTLTAVLIAQKQEFMRHIGLAPIATIISDYRSLASTTCHVHERCPGKMTVFSDDGAASGFQWTKNMSSNRQTGKTAGKSLWRNCVTVAQSVSVTVAQSVWLLLSLCSCCSVCQCNCCSVCNWLRL